jgi:DNA processing protein
MRPLAGETPWRKDALDTLFELLTFSLLPAPGAKAFRALRASGPLRDLLARPDALEGLLSAPARERLSSGEAQRAAEAELRKARALGIRLVGLDEPEYPVALRAIYDPPPVLYVKGDLQRVPGPRVAIVGARAASVRGRELTRAIARELAAAGVTIVSGLARGIDSAAHRGALEAGGSTFAVQGRGLDDVYPEENAALAAEIERSGALLSEFPLGSEPYAQNFPRRNRVIAGLCRAVLVVEAEEKSGSLITARVALDEGRDVLAVPGHPGDRLACGTNRLLKDGAALVRDARDVADEIGVELPETARVLEPDPVLRALPSGVALSLEELQARCGEQLPGLLIRLTELELAARIRRLPGPLFVRAGTSV